MSNSERIQSHTARLEEMVKQIITAGGFVFTETDQSISGLKTFSKIALADVEGNVFYLKRMNNSFVITDADEVSIFTVDTTSNKLYAFDREVAFKDEASAVDPYDDTELRNADTALSNRIKNTITNVSHTSGTGEFTFTREDGTTFTVNTLLEKVVTNFTYNETTQNLELTLEDGTTKSIPMTAFIDDYVGVDGDIITITISSDNKISATIKNGTISLDKLDSALQNTIAGKASNDASNLTSDNVTSWKNKLGVTNNSTPVEDTNKANVDASNLTSANVTSWKNKLGISGGIVKYTSGGFDYNYTNSVCRVTFNTDINNSFNSGEAINIYCQIGTDTKHAVFRFHGTQTVDYSDGSGNIRYYSFNTVGVCPNWNSNNATHYVLIGKGTYNSKVVDFSLYEVSGTTATNVTQYMDIVSYSIIKDM